MTDPPRWLRVLALWMAKACAVGLVVLTVVWTVGSFVLFVDGHWFLGAFQLLVAAMLLHRSVQVIRMLQS